MQTLVLGLLLSSAAWAQTSTTQPDFLLIASSATATPEFSTSRPFPVEPMIEPVVKPVIVERTAKPEQRQPNSRNWYLLAAASHGAAGFDAWTTRRSMQSGAVELNPLLKPFANSNAIYPALQVGPTVSSYLAKRMMRSNRPLYRKLWWVPQVASTAVSLTCGIKNSRNF